MSATSSYVSMPASANGFSNSLLPAGSSSSDTFYTSDTAAPSSSQPGLLQKLHPYRYYIAIALATLFVTLVLSAVVLTRGAQTQYVGGNVAPTNSTGGDDGGRGGGGRPGPPNGGGGDGGETGESGSGSGSGSDVATNSSCAQAKVLTEGPYWVDEKLNRSDLYSTATGQQLSLELLVYNTSIKSSCVPVVGAMVDLWTSDAEGLYSDEQVLGTKGKTFLRGYQLTNSNGLVHFLTIWPGWYQGRSVHFHVRVRVLSADGKTVIYNQTTQLFVDDDTSDAIFAAVAPYNARSGKRDTYNKNDHLFSQSMMLNTTGSIKDGFSGTLALGVPFVR